MTGEPALTQAALGRLLAELPNWATDGAALVRVDEATSFSAAVAWIVAVAQVAEAMDHHPDIDLRYRKVTWRLSTHSVGAITALDIQLARRINDIVNV